jgi:serine/threonine protein kinase
VYPWMVDLMRGLAFLQDRAQVVVHRDLNPSNLMLSEGMKKLKIFDFGLSKVFIPSTSPLLPLPCMYV